MVLGRREVEKERLKKKGRKGKLERGVWLAWKKGGGDLINQRRSVWLPVWYSRAGTSPTL